MEEASLTWTTRDDASVSRHCNGLDLTVTRSGTNGPFRFEVTTPPLPDGQPRLVCEGLQMSLVQAMNSADEFAWLSRRMYGA